MSEISEHYKKEKAQRLLEKVDKATEYLVDNDVAYKVITMTEIEITHGNYKAMFYPWKNWWSGKGVGSGRGLGELVRKIRSL